ncbi:hypothetical protein [Streptomyces sp. NPDC051994]|uniref:hypothetical protein n=1 Tax=unclassified Streptomyces TaxID=2593676 RepID=UPI00342C481C
MAEWHWECSPDELLEGLPAEALTEIARFAQEIAVRESMVFLEGAAYTGMGPGLRTESRGRVMLVHLTDVRGERIVIVQVNWYG